MTSGVTNPQAECLILGGHVIDPASGLNEVADVAVVGGRIAAVERRATGGLYNWEAPDRIDATGKIVCPGFVDLHTHVYEWVTNFGVAADDAGVGVGATTIVDQGSTGPWTFGGFYAYVVQRAHTDVRAFVSINVAGALMGGMKGDILHNPTMTDVDAVLKLIDRHPSIVRGIKCHGESGALSHWGTKVLESAAAAGVAAQLPLYVHTGQLFPVVEQSRPNPRSVLEQVLPLLKHGDVLAHIYSNMPDGIIGDELRVPSVVHRALDMGVHFDIGYGINFSFRIARMLMQEGIFPFSISSDVHGDFNSFHDNSKLNYSLPGAMNRLWSLGMPLMEVIRAVTVNPASILGAAHEIGTLAIGTTADITLCDIRLEPWSFADGRGHTIAADERLVPYLTLRRGQRFHPKLRMMPDLFLREEIENQECEV